MPNPFSKHLKKFSVITPIYGESYRTLPKFFSSLSEQAYKSFEIIVIFDGPSKKGEKELEKMITQYPNLKIRSRVIPHAGAPAARNAGASLATGDYLTFLDPDVYLYPETLSYWAGVFDENPDKDVVWGQYHILNDQGEKVGTIGAIPTDNGGNALYYCFRSSNYCSGAFPIRRDAFVGWDETVKSLQDWDMWLRMLKSDNFTGTKFLYIPRPFFATEAPRTDGISADSHAHWEERVAYVREKNGIPVPDICVSSLGAPYHGVKIAQILGADFLLAPSFKPHHYKLIYLLGFYPASHESRMAHLNTFAGSGKAAKKVIHWIGTDVWQMDRMVSNLTTRELKEIWEKEQFKHLCEVEYIQKELATLGIAAEVVPLPEKNLFTPLPLPEEFSVAVYDNPTQDMYRTDLMREVARSLPDITFYFFGNDELKGRVEGNITHLGWIDLEEWMPKFSCNLRVTLHDGLPLTPAQFFTAGRQVVTNLPLRGAIEVEAERTAIVEGIRKAEEKTLDSTTAAWWREYLDPKRFQKTIGGLL